jgi:hypothetical protein
MRDQPSPPTSTSPLPPHFEQCPLPAQELQEPSLPYPPPAKLAPEELPLPWHAGQFPSPGESQSIQTWVDMGRLPVSAAILLAFRADVKSNKRMQCRRDPVAGPKWHSDSLCGFCDRGCNGRSRRGTRSHGEPFAELRVKSRCATTSSQAASPLPAPPRRSDRSSRSRTGASEARPLSRAWPALRPD